MPHLFLAAQWVLNHGKSEQKQSNDVRDGRFVEKDRNGQVTAKGAEYDRIRGLDLGADYYLVKPFGVMELVSCVKAVLRRCGPKAAEQLRADGLVLDETEHTVTVDGERVALTYKEYELLRLFLSHPGTAFSRDQLMADVWGTDYCGETRTVDMHIRTLRQKLGPYGERIETVRGVGYRMEGRA